MNVDITYVRLAQITYCFTSFVIDKTGSETKSFLDSFEWNFITEDAASNLAIDAHFKNTQ